MSFHQLAENIPVIQSALGVQDDLPNGLRSSLHSALFACASLLSLSIDLETLSLELESIDLSEHAQNLEIDPDCLEIIIDAVSELAPKLGSYLPASKITKQLLATKILTDTDNRLLALGNQNALINFFGNEFLLLDGQLLVDTPRGRIHQVIEVNYQEKVAVLEVRVSAQSEIAEYKIFALKDGNLVENVSSLCPKSFKYITFNNSGSRVGIFEIADQDFLFQDGHKFAVKFEGDFVSADFLKEARNLAGIVQTTKYLYLIKEGKEFQRIALKDFAQPEDLQINCQLVDPKKGEQVIFWGVLKYPDRNVPYLNMIISNYTVHDVEYKVSVKDEVRRFQDQIYFVMEYGKSGQELAFGKALMEKPDHIQLHMTSELDGNSFTAIKYHPDFNKTGAATATFGDRCLYLQGKGHIPSLGEDLEILNHCSLKALPGSEQFYENLLATYKGWTLYAGDQRLFHFPQIELALNSDDITVHHESGERPTIFAIGKNNQRHFFLRGVQIKFTTPELFDSLEGVYAQEPNLLNCLFLTKHGYLCLVMEIIDDTPKLKETYSITNPEVHPWGIIGNTRKNGQEEMVVNGLLFRDFIFCQARTMIDDGGLHCPLIETDKGCLIFNNKTASAQLYPETALQDNSIPGELVVQKRSSYSPNRIDLAVNFAAFEPDSNT